MARTRRIAAWCLVAVLMAFAGPAAALNVGDKAPDFTLPAPGDKPVKLGDLLGKGPVVVYTVIQAFTPT
jgi:hypothetical protein